MTKELDLGESIALHGLSVATFLACLLFPLISRAFIEPYVIGVYGQVADLGQGNITIMIIMMSLVMLFPLTFLNYGRGVRVTDAYLSGANAASSVRFVGMASQDQEVAIGNYYLRNFFSEAAPRRGVIASAALLVILILVALVLVSSHLSGRRAGSGRFAGRSGPHHHGACNPGWARLLQPFLMC